MENIKIIIGEHNDDLLVNLKRKLSGYKNIIISGECNDGYELIIHLRNMLPDLILLNAKLPDLNLQKLTEEMNNNSHTKCLFFQNDSYDIDMMVDLLSIGSNGMIPHDISEKLLMKAIYKVVINDEIWFDRNTAIRLLVKHIHQKYNQTDVTVNPIFDPIITQREREIIKLMPEGLSNKEIGDRLSICEKTVKTHLTNIYQKLHIKTRRDLRQYMNAHTTTDNNRQQQRPDSPKTKIRPKVQLTSFYIRL